MLFEIKRYCGLVSYCLIMHIPSVDEERSQLRGVNWMV